MRKNSHIREKSLDLLSAPLAQVYSPLLVCLTSIIANIFGTILEDVLTFVGLCTVNEISDILATTHTGVFALAGLFIVNEITPTDLIVLLSSKKSPVPILLLSTTSKDMK